MTIGENRQKHETVTHGRLGRNIDRPPSRIDLLVAPFWLPSLSPRTQQMMRERESCHLKDSDAR